MKFHEAIDTYDVIKNIRPELKRHGWERAYSDMIEYDYRRAAVERNEYRLAEVQATLLTHYIEYHWRHLNRPFFNCYPVVANAIMEINSFSTSFKDLTLPVSCVCIKLPSIMMHVGRRKITNIFTCFCVDDECNKNAFAFAFRYYLDNENESRGYANRVKLDGNVDDAIEQVKSLECGTGMSSSIVTALKISVACCILSSDNKMIERVILNRDIERGNTSGKSLEDAIARAARNGVNGWNIGRELEDARTDRDSPCPHFRRHHFGIRHTGKGGTIPKLVPVKGCFVKPKSLMAVPTGYIMPDDTEIYT